jgi:tetratricopeptide (TPR) repeat protein
MNVTDFTHLINNPDSIQVQQTQDLDQVIDEFPYFQSARALQLKGLYNQDSYKYNNALKRTAAYTTDRSVLFDFITSKTFISIHTSLYEKKAKEILDIKVIDSETIVPEKKLGQKINTLEKSILTSIFKSNTVEPEEQSHQIEEKLSIGTPLDFSKQEQHSFQEWLQLSRSEPIKRDEKVLEPETLMDEEKRKKLELIDKFIETSPKITPGKHGVTTPITIDINTTDNSSLMTETLARVYLEQKKYQKAIQAYEILILKYPEKSSFFANRISDIKILQHNNN